MIVDDPGPFLGAGIVSIACLGALGIMLEPSEGSWRGSWRHLGALLAALGVLFERL